MKVAIVRETDCVGCAKCLPACPVDAIIGAPKFLHTVLTEECIGCGLCVAPCPMDCIEMIENSAINTAAVKEERAHKAKYRYKARQKRLALNEPPKLLAPTDPVQKAKIKQEIQAAVLRVQAKMAKKVALKPHNLDE